MRFENAMTAEHLRRALEHLPPWTPVYVRCANCNLEILHTSLQTISGLDDGTPMIALHLDLTAASRLLQQPAPAGSLADDLDYLRKKLSDEATSAFDQSNGHRTQKRWELRGINKALRYAQTYLDWLLDVRHRPGGPNPLAPQTPPTGITRG